MEYACRVLEILELVANAPGEKNSLIQPDFMKKPHLPDLGR